jgi:diketogulonate reductase-like aldo/keto reductase
MNRREALRLLGLGAIALTSTSNTPGAEPGKSTNPHTREIPSSGESLPVIGLGTSRTFDVGSSAEARAPLEQVLKAFVEIGGKVVDTSPMYGKAEEVVGDLSARLKVRDRLFLATKVWTTGREAGVKQMEDSLAKLKTGTVDLMQVHNLVDVETQLKTLRDWKASKRIRYLGVTHYSAGSHDAVAKVMAGHALDFVQINYSVGEREAEARILPLARERGIAILANRPFSGGDLFSRLRKRPLPSWAAEIDCTSWAQIMLKYVVSHPAITCAIPATSKVAHLLDNMAAGLGRLPDEDFRKRIAKETA